MSGWIKIHRKITKHWIWDNPEYLKAWLDILMLANHEPRKKLINNDVAVIKTGHRDLSLRFLAKRWKWSVGRVQRFLKLLKNDTMIDTQTDTGQTIVSVCNYGRYQVTKAQSDTPNDTLTDTRSIHRRVQREELKELKELKRESKSVQLKNIKDSFSELKKKFPDADVESEYDKFTDWMDSKGKQYKDYSAGFRNWLRRANAFQRRSDGGNKVEFAKTPSGLWKAYCSKCKTTLLYNKPPYPNTTSECCGKDIYNYDPTRVSA